MLCFEHVEGTVNIIGTIQKFGSFQFGRQFLRWPPWAILKILFLPKKTGVLKTLFYQYVVWVEYVPDAINVISTIWKFNLLQYGRQFPTWPPSAIIYDFALKWQQTVKNMIWGTSDIYLSKLKVKLIEQILFKCSDHFNLTVSFQNGRHGLP